MLNLVSTLSCSNILLVVPLTWPVVISPIQDYCIPIMLRSVMKDAAFRRRKWFEARPLETGWDARGKELAGCVENVEWLVY